MATHRTAAGTSEDIPIGKPYDEVEFPPAAERIATGEIVGIDHPKYPGRWTIVKVNDRTCKLVRGGQGLTADKAMLIKPPAVDNVPVRPDGVHVGGIIRIEATRYRGAPQDGLMVVLDTRGEKVKAAPLGGTERGTFWRVADQHIAEVISVARVSITPATS